MLFIVFPLIGGLPWGVRVEKVLSGCFAAPKIAKGGPNRYQQPHKNASDALYKVFRSE